MDKLYLEILNEIGIESLELLDGTLIERDILLDTVFYKRLILKMSDIKCYYSSSLLTSLHNNASVKQIFPLINIIRQLLRTNNYKMEPVRKSNGYEQSGKKLYKRYFLIKKMMV